MLIPRNCLVLVADGGRFSLYRNAGSASLPDLQLITEKGQHIADAADLGSDQPGRSFSSTGSRRNTYEATDFHRLAEDRFAGEAITVLDSQVEKFSGGVIVVAAPKTLGTMRRSYSDRITKHLIGEIDKDYADRSAREVEKALMTWEA